MESVGLMEKRVRFAVEGKGQPEFEDYITQFYEEELSRVRGQLRESNNRVR